MNGPRVAPPPLSGTTAAVLDAVPAHVAVLDTAGDIVFVNAAWARFAQANGIEVDVSCIGQNYPLLCDHADGDASCEANAAAAGIRAVLSGEAAEFSLDYPCHSPTDDRWFRMSATRLPADPGTGAAGGAVVMHVDISERKHAEVVALFEQAEDLILQINAAGRIETVNPAFTRATGWLSVEAHAQVPPLWTGTPPQQPLSGVCVHLRRRDGGSFTAEWSISPIRNRDGDVVRYVCVGRDITQRQRIQSSLLENDKLRAVATLAGGIAHDFNNLLASIGGFAELCELDAPEGSRLARNLAQITLASDKAAVLVRQLLDFSRQVPLSTQAMQVGELLQHADGLLRTMLPPNVSLTLRVDEDSPVSIDPVQMEQVLFNLTRNAIQATLRRGGEITIVADRLGSATRLSAPWLASDAPERVRIRVIDTGDGIGAETLTRIFEPFFTTKPIGEGTGLGLAAVAGIVGKHGGTVDVTSEVGRGTCFSLLLPLLGAAGVQDAAPRPSGRS